MKLCDELTARLGNAATVRENIPLAPYTTFGIGGPADLLIEPESTKALSEALALLRAYGIRTRIFGNCSNVVFADAGFRGAVLLTRRMRAIRWEQNEVWAEAGASLIALSAQAAKKSLTGFEFACGIPGTVGGAVRMNAGAYGREMKDIVVFSEYLDENGKIGRCIEHDFSYRHSVYQKTNRILLSCRLSLLPGDPMLIQETMQTNRKKREATQPIGEKSAGSVFRRADGVIPARLINEAGLKGLAVNGACVSEKHAGFIVNTGQASAADVAALTEQIIERIFRRYHIQLQPEIEFVSEK